MKTKLVLLAAVMCLSMAGFSQTSFGIRAGVNFQNLNGKDNNGDKISNSLKPGFNVGVNAEIPVAPDYYVQPGLLLSTKGAKDGSAKINLSYLEIPINFLYKPMLGQGRLLMGFGPYVAFGVGGQVKADSYKTDVKWESSITPGQAISGTPYFKRFDAGANFLFGYEMSSKISAQLNAQLGLLNIYPKVDGTSDKTSVKNTGFGVSLGYRF
jgi:hypothetical protein